MRDLFIKCFGRFMAVLGCSTMVTACYGVPMESFHVKGRVTDAETGKPVAGLKMTVTPGWDYGITSGAESIKLSGEHGTSLTEADGSFIVTCYQYGEPEAYKVECEDVDGQANGEYISFDKICHSSESDNLLLEITPVRK